MLIHRDIFVHVLPQKLDIADTISQITQQKIKRKKKLHLCAQV